MYYICTEPIKTYIIMEVIKNNGNTFDIKGITLGKLYAIVNAIDKLKIVSPVQEDIRNIIKNNIDYQKLSK